MAPQWLTKEKQNTAAVDLRHRLQCYDDARLLLNSIIFKVLCMLDLSPLPFALEIMAHCLIVKTFLFLTSRLTNRPET